MGGIGKRPAWAWIFILEGLFTVAFGLFAFWILPGAPEGAWFLTREEKVYVAQRLKAANNAGRDDSEKFSWCEVKEAFKSPHIWFLAINTFFGSAIVYSLAYFAPSIVLSLGFSPIRTQLMSVPPFAAAFVVTLITAYLADRYRARGLTVIFSSLCCIAGFSIYLASTGKWILYGSLFLTIGGSSAVGPAHTTWQSNNTSPHIRKATGIAFLIMMANCSGILAIWLFGFLSEPPRYTTAMITMLTFSCLIELVAGINIAYLWSQNKKKRLIRAVMKKEDEASGLGDKSAWFEYIL
ncbi:hypothetical protein NP233_g1135 [Leucocoprinus birnbaumii]|uniref:MFS general substrate transporter n=1 Tax=Leucocoprinus birnbaumii TaxID=56174 RepID=A0AAD5YZS8_9AGAR|nr:hypothetical protein NP233_g1135 [Leucocoprinus birnbaumii]